MANVDVTVKAALKYYSGTAATSVAVKAIRQANPDLAADMNTADIIEATSNGSTGIVTLTLKGTDDVPVTYKIQLPDQQYFYLTLPKNAKACNLGPLTVSQGPNPGVKNITGQISTSFQGQDLASAAAIAPTCAYHYVTGTTNITSITATDVPVGQLLTLKFADALDVVNGNNIQIDGTFTTTAGSLLHLICDGTNFLEVNRVAG